MNYGSISEKTKAFIKKIEKEPKDERLVLFGFNRKAAYLSQSLWTYDVRFCMRREKEGNLHGTLQFAYNEKGLVSVHTDDPITEEEKAYMTNSLKVIPRYAEMIEKHTEYAKDMLTLLNTATFSVEDFKQEPGFGTVNNVYSFHVLCGDIRFDGMFTIHPKTLVCESYQLSQKEEFGFDKAFEVLDVLTEHKPELFQTIFNRIRLTLITQ